MLEIRQLNKTYGAHRALTDLNLQVPEAEFLGYSAPMEQAKLHLSASSIRSSSKTVGK